MNDALLDAIAAGLRAHDERVAKQLERVRAAEARLTLAEAQLARTEAEFVRTFGRPV